MADWGRLPALKTVDLWETEVTGDIVELVGKFPTEIEEKLLSGWLQGTKITGDIAELVLKLPPTTKRIHVASTGCFGDVSEAFWGWLTALEGVYLKGTKITGTEGDIRAHGCTARVVHI